MKEVILSIDDNYLHPDWEAWGRTMAQQLAKKETGSTSNGNGSDSSEKELKTLPIREQTLEEIFFD